MVLLQLILMVLQQQIEARAAAALMVNKVTFIHVSKSVVKLSGKAQFRVFSQKMKIAKFSSCPGVCSTSPNDLLNIYSSVVSSGCRNADVKTTDFTWLKNPESKYKVRRQ